MENDCLIGKRIIDIDVENKIHSSVLKIREDKNNVIWLATQQGLWKYAEGKLTQIKEKNLEKTYNKIFETDSQFFKMSKENR